MGRGKFCRGARFQFGEGRPLIFANYSGLTPRPDERAG